MSHHERCIYMKRQLQIFLTNCIIKLNFSVNKTKRTYVWYGAVIVRRSNFEPLVLKGARPLASRKKFLVGCWT